MYYQSGDTDIQMATLKRSLNIARNGSNTTRRRRRPRKSTGRKVYIVCYNSECYWYLYFSHYRFSPYVSEIGVYLYYILFTLFLIYFRDLLALYRNEGEQYDRRKGGDGGHNCLRYVICYVCLWPVFCLLLSLFVCKYCYCLRISMTLL